MPKFDESRMAEACLAASREEKPNIARLAREFGVNQSTLYRRDKKGTGPNTAKRGVGYALEAYQEEALIRWIQYMNDCYIPITPRILESWANRVCQRVGKPPISKI